MNGRSLFRLATALHLVPDQLSAQAFHDLVEELYPGPQERRYFEERRMLQEGEERPRFGLKRRVSAPKRPRSSMCFHHFSWFGCQKEVVQQGLCGSILSKEPDASWLQPVSDENGEPRLSA